MARTRSRYRTKSLAPPRQATGAAATQHGGTANREAYREYLRGNALLPLRRVEDLREAVTHYERAIALDPNYATAHAMAAVTLTLLDARSPISPQQSRQRDDLVRRAIELDPKLGEAYVARASILRNSDPVAADRDFRNGLALAPNFTIGYVWYAMWLTGHEGRAADAIPIAERAISIDPLDTSLRVNLGVLLLSVGRVEEATAISDHAYRADPESPQALELRGVIFRARGDLTGELRTADAVIALDPASMRARRSRCDILWFAGLTASTRRCLRALRKYDATVATQYEAFLEFIEAYERGDKGALRAALERMEDPDPAFRAILARLEGRPADAVAILRVAWPAWFANPIGRPNIDHEYDFIDAAAALIAAGDQAQADRVLDYGMRKIVLAREPGSTFGGRRGWTDVMAFALLGKLDRACAALEASVAAGLYQLPYNLQGEPLFAPLRAQPCYAPAYARIRELADAQVAAAVKAGLL
jgi:tetratricopeptide (TPR) repeat protein